MDILDNLIIPHAIIAYGVRGKRIRRTDVVTRDDGSLKTNAIWGRTLRSYDLGLIPRRAEDWETIATIHDILRGRAYGCLLRDPIDSRVEGSEGLMAPRDADGVALGTVGVGYGVPRYRLVKRKTYLGYNSDSDISKPDSGSVVLRRNGSTVTIGASPGNAAIAYTSGYVTFVADASQNVSAVAVGATTDVTLAATVGLAIGERLWLQGLTGTHASLLNDLSHVITGISVNTYTLSTNTAGKTITAAGTGKAYPQADDALTWSGTFHIPVAFESDDLDWQLVSSAGDEDDRLVMGPSVPLLEVPIA